MNEDGNATATPDPRPIPPKNCIAGDRRILDVWLQFGLLQTCYLDVVIMEVGSQMLNRAPETIAVPLQNSFGRRGGGRCWRSRIWMYAGAEEEDDDEGSRVDAANCYCPRRN